MVRLDSSLDSGSNQFQLYCGIVTKTENWKLDFVCVKPVVRQVCEFDSVTKKRSERSNKR